MKPPNQISQKYQPALHTNDHVHTAQQGVKIEALTYFHDP